MYDVCIMFYQNVKSLCTWDACSTNWANGCPCNRFLNQITILGCIFKYNVYFFHTINVFLIYYVVFFIICQYMLFNPYPHVMFSCHENVAVCSAFFWHRFVHNLWKYKILNYGGVWLGIQRHRDAKTLKKVPSSACTISHPTLRNLT